MNIQEFRQKYPQYGKLSDDELGQRLFKKHYASSLSWDEFAWRFGLPEKTAPAGVPQTTPPVGQLAQEAGAEAAAIGEEARAAAADGRARNPSRPTGDWLGDVVFDMRTKLTDLVEAPAEPSAPAAFLPTPWSERPDKVAIPEMNPMLQRQGALAQEQLLGGAGMSGVPEPTLMARAFSAAFPPDQVPPGGDPAVAQYLANRPRTGTVALGDALALGIGGPFGEVTSERVYDPAMPIGPMARQFVEEAGAPVGIGAQLGKDFLAGGIGTLGGIWGYGSQLLESPEMLGLARTVEGASTDLLPTDPSFADKLAAALGSTLALYGPARALAPGPWTGALGAAGLESMAEAGGVREQVLNDPGAMVDANQAANRAMLGNALMLALTNRFGLFGDIGGPVTRRGLAGLGEATQEGYQEITNELAQGKVPEAGQVGESAAIGGIVGSTLGGGPTPIEQLGKYLQAAEERVQIDPRLIDEIARQALAPSDDRQPGQLPAFAWEMPAPESRPQPPTAQPPTEPPKVEALGDLLARLRPPEAPPTPEAAPSQEPPPGPPSAPPAASPAARNVQRERAQAYGLRAYRSGLGKQGFNADTEVGAALESFTEAGATPVQVRAWWQLGWLDGAKEAGDESMDPQESLYANRPPAAAGQTGRRSVSDLTTEQLVALGRSAGYPEGRLKNLGSETRRKTVVTMLQELEDKGLLDWSAIDVQPPAGTPKPPAGEERGVAKPKAKRSGSTREPDIEKDDLLGFVALGGGVDWAGTRGAFDPVEKGRRGSGIHRIFRTKNGRSMDGMAEYLRQFGFEFEGPNDLEEAMQRALAGNRIYSPWAKAPLEAEVAARDEAMRAAEDARRAADEEQRRLAGEASDRGEDPFAFGAPTGEFFEDGEYSEAETSSPQGRIYLDALARATALDPIEAESIMDEYAAQDDQVLLEQLEAMVRRHEDGKRRDEAGNRPSEEVDRGGPAAAAAEGPAVTAVTPGGEEQTDWVGGKTPQQQAIADARRDVEGRLSGPDVQAGQGEDLLSGGRLEPSLLDQAPTAPAATEPRAAPGGMSAADRALGDTNTVFTKDAAEAAIARIKAKLGGPGTLHAGIDPTILADAIVAGGYFVEAGVREFGAWARKMLDLLGQGIKPYLVAIYEGIRDQEDLSASVRDAMTPPEGVRPALRALTAPASRPTATLGNETLYEALAGRDVTIEIEAGGQTLTVSRDAAQALKDADALVAALEEIKRRCL